jgi:hypothetical protein
MSSQNVLDAGGRTQREIAALAQPGTVRRDVAMNLPKAKDLASWENEGGATAVAPPRGADKATADTYALKVMRISLLLLVPAIGSGAIFWGLLVGSAPQ